MNIQLTSALNVLFLLSDLCNIIKPLYNNAEVPVAMTTKLLNRLLDQASVPDVTSALTFSLKMLLVYLYQQDSDGLDSVQLGHNILLQSMVAPDLTLFTVWKNLLRLRFTVDILQEEPVMKDTSNFVPRVMTPNASLVANGLYIYQQYMDLPSKRMVLFHDLFLLEKKENTRFSVLTSGKNFTSLTGFNPSWQPELTGSDSVPQTTVIDKRHQTMLCLIAERVNAEKQLHERLFDLYGLYGFHPSVVEGEEEEVVLQNEVPQLTPIPVYVGPTTSDETTYNNCFLNSALVSLLMFPSAYVLSQIYKTAVQKVHVLDTTSQMCFPKERGSWMDYRNYITRDLAKNNNNTVSLDIVQQVARMINTDYEFKKRGANAFRTCLETFQTGVNPNAIRRTLRELLTTCQSLLSGKMIENRFGEPEVVFEFFQEMFSPPTNFLEKHIVCESPIMSTYNAVQRDVMLVRSLVIPVPIPSAENQVRGDTLLTYFRAQINQVLESENLDFECNSEKLYNKRTITLKYISGTFFCFTVTRTNFVALEDGSEDPEDDGLEGPEDEELAAGQDEEDKEHDYALDDSKSVVPDPVFALSDGSSLPLRAVIVTQGGYHFVCYVLNTFTNQWLYFNGGQLREVGDYNALLAHNDEEVIWRGTSYLYG